MSRVRRDIEKNLRENNLQDIETEQDFESQPEELSVNLIDDENDQDDYDMFEEDDVDSYDDEEEYEDSDGFFQNLSSSIGDAITGKGKAIIVIVLAIVAVVIFLFNPFNRSADDTESSGGFFSNLFPNSKTGEFFESLEDEYNEEEVIYDEDGNPIEPDTTRTIEEVTDELNFLYPFYDIQYDSERALFTLHGDIEGEEHYMEYSDEGEILFDSLSDEYNKQEDPETEGPSTEEPSTEEPTTEEPSTEEPETDPHVKIDEDIYYKSTLSMDEQKVVKTDTNITNRKERFIVRYEKLPLRGRVPQIYSEVIETGEPIIFTVPMNQYVELEETGTTVIELQVETSYGVITYNDIYIVNWR